MNSECIPLLQRKQSMLLQIQSYPPIDTTENYSIAEGQVNIFIFVENCTACTLPIRQKLKIKPLTMLSVEIKGLFHWL